MTVHNQELGNTHIISTSAGAFPIGFEIQDESHITVTLLDADGETETTLVLDTDYTVSEDLKTITLTTAMAEDEVLSIARDTPKTQAVNFRNATNSLIKRAEDIETALDKLTYIFLEIDDELSRATGLTGYLKANGTAVTLPTPVANAYIKYNSDGTGLTSIVLRTSGSYIEEVEDDTAPQLGGNLNTNGNKITSVNNGDVIIQPNGTGVVKLGGTNTNGCKLDFYEDSSNGNDYVRLKAQDNITNTSTLTLPTALPSVASYLMTDASGNLSTTSTIANAETLLESGSLGSRSYPITSVGTGSVGSLEFDLDDWDSFTHYKLVLFGVRTTSVLQLQTSADGGTTWDGGASDYRYWSSEVYTPRTSATPVEELKGDDAHTAINIVYDGTDTVSALGSATTGSYNNDLEIDIWNPYDTSRTIFGWRASCTAPVLGETNVFVGGGSRLGSAAINAIRLKTSNTTTLGLACDKYALYGIGGDDTYTNPTIPLFGDSLSFPTSVVNDKFTMTYANFGSPAAQTKITVGATISLQSGTTCKLYSGSGGGYFYVSINADEAIVMFNNSALQGYQYYMPASRLNTGADVHLAIIIDSTQAVTADRCKLYLNGELCTSRYAYTNDIGLNATTDIGTTNTTIGTFIGYMYQPFMILGNAPTIDELYNTTTKQAKDVSGLTGLHSLLTCAGGSAVADDVLVADWTAGGAATSAAVTPKAWSSTTGFANSMYCPNTTDYGIYMTNTAFSTYSQTARFDIASMSGTKMVISTWFKNTASDSGTIFCCSQTNGGTKNIELSRTEGSYYEFNVLFTTAGRVTLRSTAPSSSTTDWVHIVAILDTTQATAADRMKIYENGTIIDNDTFGSGTFPGLNDTWVQTVSTGSVSWGYQHSTSTPLLGKFTDMAIFDGGLGTLPTAATLYNAGARLHPATIADISSCKSIVAFDSKDVATRHGDLRHQGTWQVGGTFEWAADVPAS